MSSKVLTVTINGTTRNNCIIQNTLKITDEARDKPSTLVCEFYDYDGNGDPSEEQEITLVLDGTTIFGGYIIKINELRTLGDGNTLMKLECIDYNRLLDRRLVVEGYQDMTDKAIIEDIINNYCGGSGITTTNVIEGITIDQLSFNYLPPSSCFSKICELTGRSWYLDYDKALHYFEIDSKSAPFLINA